MAFCNYCGSKMSEDAKVCPSCGKPVSAAAKSAAPKRVVKKKSPGPTIALFSACAVVMAAIVLVFIVGISHYGGGVTTADPAEDASPVYRTVDLSVVEEEMGDYDNVDTIIFTDKNGETYTSESIENGLATVELSEGDYTYKVITKNGEKYTGTVTVPAVSEDASSGKTGADAKSTVTVDPTPIVVTPDTPAQPSETPASGDNSSAQPSQTPASGDSSSAEAQPAENEGKSGSEPAAAGSEQTPSEEQSSAEEQKPAEEQPASEDEAGTENVTVPEFIHFSVEDREEESFDEGNISFTYNAQYVELSASSAADFPALASALEKDAQDRYDADTASIKESLENDSGLGAGMNGEWERVVSVVRADSTIFSVRYSVDGYFPGAAHGFAYAETVSYDPQTGRELAVSDVVKNTDLLISCLDEQASEYYEENLQMTVSDFVDMNGLDSLCWTMDYNGLTVTFNSYDLSDYASGPFSADLTFKDNPDLFDEKWTSAPDDYAVLLCSGENSTGAGFDLNGDGTAEAYDFYTLINDVLPEFFGSYDEKYVHDNNLVNAIYDGEIELTAVYGVKTGGNTYICVFAEIPDLESGELRPAFGTFKAAGDGYEMTGIYIGEAVTLDEQITDPSLFYVTDEEGGSVPAYISTDGELCLN